MANFPDEVERAMRAGEKILWIGYPIPTKFVFRGGIRGFLFVILFGSYWIAFCGFAEYDAIKSGNLFMQLWVVPFVIVGLFILTCPLWVYLRARRTIYVVSNQRLLILNAFPLQSIRSFAPADIGFVEVDARYDGIGSIIFSRTREPDPEGGWIIKEIGFIAISNVREAAKHVVLLKEQKMNPAPPG
jgi:hypothetical protein